MLELEDYKRELEKHKNACARLEKRICELAKESMSKRWRADKNKYYWYISSYGEVSYSKENNDEIDNARYKIGNYYETREEVEKVAEKIKIYAQLKDLALRLNRGKKIDWKNNNQVKWHICYENGTALGLDDMYTCTLQDLGQIYCLDKNFLEIAKQEIGGENLRKLFE